MTGDVFTREIERLGGFFGKRLTETQADLYYLSLRQVPNEVFEAVCSELVENRKPNPSNFPSVRELKELWAAWIRDNPRRTVPEPDEHQCGECGGRGYFNVWRRSPHVKGFAAFGGQVEAWYGTSLPCALCGNWRRRFPTSGPDMPKRRWTKAEILDAGMLLQDPYWVGNTPWWKAGRLNTECARGAEDRAPPPSHRDPERLAGETFRGIS